MRRLVNSVFFILIFLITTVFADEPQSLRTITVSGTAVTQVMPDLVVWSISISDFDKNIKIAKEKNDDKFKRILALQESLNINKTDWEISYLRIHKEYERDERGYVTEKFKHFVIARSLIIRQHDLKRFDEFLDKFVSSAEMEVSFSLHSSQIYEIRKETRLKALRIAKEKAIAMLEIVGAKIGKVLTINELQPSPSQNYQQIWQNDNSVTSISLENRSIAIDTAIATFAPEAIDVRVTVSVIFEIQ